MDRIWQVYVEVRRLLNYVNARNHLLNMLTVKDRLEYIMTLLKEETNDKTTK